MKITRRKFAMSSAALAAAGVANFNILREARAQAEEIRIGMLAALSGPTTAWGLASQRGVQMAVDEANEAGGLQIGGRKVPLKLISYDDQGNPAQASAAANRLISQDKVVAIMGPVGSPPSLGALPVTQPAKILQMCDGFAPALLKNEWNGAYVFRLFMTPMEFAGRFIGWYKENLPQAKRVGIVAPNDSVGQLVMPLYVESYKKAGFEPIIEFYERGSKEFTPLMLRLNAQRVDIIDLSINPPGDSGLMIRQARQSAFRGRFVQTGGAGADELIGLAGNFAEGLLFYEPLDWSVPTVAAFQAAYTKRWPGVMNSQSPTYFAATRILIEAIRRTGGGDSTQLRDMIETMAGYDTGVLGSFGLTGKETYGVNHQFLWPFYLKEVKDGKPVTRAVFQPT